jgi:uncharacterized membrane-anchored protein
MAGRHHSQAEGSYAFAGVPKVPAVKPYFWAVKLLTTAMGEAVSDYFVKQYNQYLVVFAGFVVFAIAISWQFRTRGYRTWPYWSAVAMVAVFGTMVADAMHIGLGIPYKVSATLFAISLAVILFVWYRAEGTLSIHSIYTPRREFFYWATVICTFALGTATGDLTAITFHLGYIASAFMFLGAICVPLVAWRLGANPVLTFWAAYILTRPIGASFADFFGMPKDVGGMGIGHGPVSVVTLVLVLASFMYLSRTGIDTPELDAPADIAMGTSGAAWAGAGTTAQRGDAGYQQPPWEAAAERYGRPDPYAQRPEPYAQQPDPYARRPDAYGRRPDAYGQQPEQYVRQPDPYGRQPQPYPNQPEQYGRRPEPYQQEPDPYGRAYPDTSGESSGWSR